MNHKDMSYIGRKSRLLSMLIATILAFSGFPSVVLAEELNAPSYYSVQPNLDYEITTNITSSWNNHESVDLVLANTGSETIHNWYLTFYTPYNIENIWNGTIYETDGNGTYTITSNGWNQDIRTGEFVTVGITFSSDTETELSVDTTWYLLNTQATVVDSSQYTLVYTEYSAWETGFTGQLTLTPQVDCQHWELSFGSNREIAAVSSAVLLDEGDNNYTITHDENNMRLLADTAYNFGIQGDNTEDLLNLSNVELTVVDLAYHLTDDEDANGIPDYLEFIGGGSIVVPPPTPTPTPVPTETPTITPTEEPTGNPTVAPSATPSPTSESTPTETEDPYYGLRDSDSDGLLDYLEEIYGTDIDNPDTDGDGLLDGDEINIGTSPNNPDTNGNGLIDFDEDCDGDGITNGGEYSTGTCMFAYDSDYDGINDYNEVYFYGIDPRNEDSDSDGIKDGDEVTLGLNPGSSDSDGDGITDDYVMFSQSLSMDPIAEDHPHEITGVSISGNISGLITSNTTIEDTYNRDIYCTDVYGRVGVPINIESEGHFDSMTLTINYDEGALGDTNEADLGVLWYDEDTGFFITQEHAVVDIANNIITVDLNHFSTYILVDMNKWNNPIMPFSSGCYRTVYYNTSGPYYDFSYTIAPERYEETAWNQYLNSNNGNHRDEVLVETVDMGHFFLFGGLNYHYEWKVWSQLSNDADHDGIPDMYESRGILGMDGNIYYSDPDKLDTDGDMIIDGDEFSSIYILHRFEDGKLQITLNNTVVYDSEDGSISPDSVFFYFVRYAVNLECGNTLCVASVISDPKNDDTDHDGYIDYLDARPFSDNSDVIYVFTSVDCEDYANLISKRYSAAGGDVINRTFTDFNTLNGYWDGIGLHKSYFESNYIKPYGNKYYYNASNVILFAHGSGRGQGIVLGEDYNSSWNYVFSRSYLLSQNENPDLFCTTDDLIDKIIDILVLYSCYCGVNNEMLNGTRNMAEDFLDNNWGISKVIAPDSLLWWSNGHFYFIGYLEKFVCDDDYYNSIRNSVSSNTYTGNYIIVNSIWSLQDICGFVVFSRESNPTDLFVDDVNNALLLVTLNNSNEYGEGIFLFDYDVVDQLGDRFNDPVLGY